MLDIHVPQRMHYSIENIKEILVDTSFRRMPESKILIPPDSGMRRNDDAEIARSFLKKFLLILSLLLLPALVNAEVKNGTKLDTPPGQVIPVDESDIKILHRASEILSGEDKWNRYDDRQCPDIAMKFSLYCALYNASEEINGEFDHRIGALEETRRTVVTVSKGKAYEHRLMGYNNDPSTSFKDIKKVLEVTEKRISERLGHK